MTESQIERLAEEVLAAHGLTAPPVDPFALARLEGVRLAPGRYDGCFDGRIEYRTAPCGGIGSDGKTAFPDTLPTRTGGRNCHRIVL